MMFGGAVNEKNLLRILQTLQELSSDPTQWQDVVKIWIFFSFLFWSQHLVCYTSSAMIHRSFLLWNLVSPLQRHSCITLIHLMPPPLIHMSFLFSPLHCFQLEACPPHLLRVLFYIAKPFPLLHFLAIWIPLLLLIYQIEGRGREKRSKPEGHLDQRCRWLCYQFCSQLSKFTLKCFRKKQRRMKKKKWRKMWRYPLHQNSMGSIFLSVSYHFLIVGIFPVRY